MPKLLGIAEELPEVVAADEAGDEATDSEPLRCGRCNCELINIQSTKRRGLRKVFERLYARPNVYSPMWHVGYVAAKYSTSSPRPWQPDG